MVFVVLATSAQNVRTPEKNSAERREILGALRSPIERELGQKIVFVIDEFRVYQNWAFLSGRPQTPSGNTPDYRRTPYESGTAKAFSITTFLRSYEKVGIAGKW
mgnify:CR=1 FL=1